MTSSKKIGSSLEPGQLMLTHDLVVCVLANLSQHSEFLLWEYLLTTRPMIGWVKGTASLTGVVLLLLICLMVLCSSTFVRRSGHFEVRVQKSGSFEEVHREECLVLMDLPQVFYWSHLSYIWVLILLIVHCANFWKWFVVPGLLFLLEKIVGIAVSRMGGLYIVEVNLLPSKVRKENMMDNIPLKSRFLQEFGVKCSLRSALMPSDVHHQFFLKFSCDQVTHLVIKRPQFFHFKPGDYIYINIPVIAKYEWHPFTISSAPEQSGTEVPATFLIPFAISAPLIQNRDGMHLHRKSQWI